MKKIITLCLALAGMVGTVSAENVTRRIVVENQIGASWSEWATETLYIHCYTTSSETQLSGTWGTATMTYQGAYTGDNQYRRVYYYDLTADESVFKNSISIIVFNETGKNTQDAYNRITWEGTYSNDLIIYVYPKDGYAAWSTQPLSYFFVNSSGTNLSTLTYTQGTQVATGTYTHSGDDVYAVIAPNYALWDNFAGIRDWSLVFRPVSANDYEISSFTNYSGSISTSNVNNKTFKFSYASNYNFSFDIDGTSFTITPYIESTVTSANVATFSSEYAVAIPDGLTASYVTGVGDDNVLTTVNFSNGIPASTGALLIPSSTLSATTTYQFTPATSTDAVTGNKLVACTTSTTISQKVGDKYNYILTTQTVNGNADPKFYLVNGNGNTVSAGRAYLQLDEAAGARQYFSIWASDANSIDALEQEQTADGQAYNLAGQRIAQPTKGLYIVNGKKFIKK